MIFVTFVIRATQNILAWCSTTSNKDAEAGWLSAGGVAMNVSVCI